MLDAKDKKKLRKEAQDRRSLFQIGKDGIGDKLIDTLEDSLRAHELVKLNLLKSAPLTTAEAAEILAQETGSEIVHIIGHTFVLYRRSKKNLMGLQDEQKEDDRRVGRQFRSYPCRASADRPFCAAYGDG